ncbi:MAG: T9SS type A sorting domain-containing protein [Saprospirales bacterium]|nr:T9SS type A sorting domain-containing protein [Saprospirales bacterium]
MEHRLRIQQQGFRRRAQLQRQRLGDHRLRPRRRHDERSTNLPIHGPRLRYGFGGRVHHLLQAEANRFLRLIRILPLRFVEIANPPGVILVYPNPTDTEATISFSEPTEVQGLVRVYTQNNRFVLERVIPIHTTDYVLPLAQLPGEAYILQVVVGGKQWSKRLVVD